MNVKRLILAMILILPAGLTVGCVDTTPNVAPVSGMVTLDGKPLANAVVTFQPLATNGSDPGPSSEAVTDAHGIYVLKVPKTGQVGAVIGRHRVEVQTSAAKVMSGKDGRGSPARVNDKQGRTFEVPPGGTSDADIDLASR
jgi:hypothetical protein